MSSSAIFLRPEGCGFADLSRTRTSLAMLGVALALLMAAMGQAIAISAMPRAIAGLDGFARYSWPTTSLLLTSTLAIPVFAKLSDLYGRKRLYLWSMATFTISLLLCGAAGDLPVPLSGMSQLIFVRGVQGVGNGAVIALSYTLVADLFPPSERGRFQGLLAAVSGVAYAAGPGFGGWVTDHFSWRWAFDADAPLGVAAIVVIYFSLPDFRPRVVPGVARRVIDWAGIVTLCGWLVPLLLALTLLGQSSWSPTSIQALLIASAGFLVAFMLAEKRAEDPLLALDLFGDRNIAIMSANFFLLGISVFGVAVYLPLFVQGVLGESAARSGIIFAQYTLSLVAGNVIGGQFLSRTGKYRFLSVGGAALSMIGLFLLSRMDSGTSPIELLRNVIVSGIGFGTLNPTYEVVVQNATPVERMGVATGATRFFNMIGGAIGLALFGTVLLRLYHLQLDLVIPSGTPLALTHPFDNPLQLFFTRPNLETGFTQIANGRILLANLMAGARAGLLSALRYIFLIGASFMAVSFAMNLFLTDPPAQKEF